jgi:hypothetical protein
MTYGSKGTQPMAVGLNLGDRYTYLCVLDTESAEVMEEGLLCAPPPRLWSNASRAASGCTSLSRRVPTRRG